MIKPPNLKKGDKIAIAAPARKIAKDELIEAFEIIERFGFEIVYSDSLFAEANQFAGGDEIRKRDIQNFIDNDDIKAILFARGGYGCVRIVDKIDFKGLLRSPKWLAGYSDITVLLNHVAKNFAIETIHSSMPINFSQNTSDSIELIFNVLTGEKPEYKIPKHMLNRRGNGKGRVFGGNLSVLYSLLGSDSFPETENNILFIEDLDEYLYHIDRMMMALRRSGKLENLSALIVGGMTNMNDNKIPFGKDAENIIAEAVSDYNFPVCFGFPAGHMDRNLPLVIGAMAKISIESENTKLVYL